MPRRAEDSPIAGDEPLLRLIWHDYLPRLGKALSEKAFKPPPNDTDGLSLFRAECLENLRDALAAIQLAKRCSYGCALFVWDDVERSVGWRLAPRRITAAPGHIVVKDLTVASYATDAGRELAKKLTLIASRRVFRPEDDWRC